MRGRGVEECCEARSKDFFIYPKGGRKGRKERELERWGIVRRVGKG